MDREHDLQHRLGRAVRALRGRRGLSRRELSQRTGISERFLVDIEAGRANPSLRRVEELAGALGTSPQALLSAWGPDGPAGAEAREVVALLGLRGAGKSTVGALLAGRLGCAFVELDARVEAASGMSLGELFELHGEVHYRRVEREALEEILHQGGALVLAAGGGLVTEAETYALLRRLAHTVWLRAAPRDHWTRVVAQGDLRPMARDERAFASLCSLLAAREPLYRMADVQVETSGRTPEDVAGELALRFTSLRMGAGAP